MFEGGGYQTLLLAGFIIYVGIMIFIGWFFSRRKNEGTNYLTGGKSISTILIIATIGATMVSTGSSMGATANGFRSGFAGSTYVLGCAVALFMLGFLFSKMRDKNFITMPEEVQYYFKGDKRVRKLMAAVLFLAEIMFAGSQMNGGSKYLQFVTGIDPVAAKFIILLAFGLYVFIGGYLAVVWTDLFQFGIILVGFAVIVANALPAAGGMEEIAKAYTAAGNTGALSFFGVRSYGLMGTVTLIIATIFNEIGIPVYRTRIFTAKDVKTARNGYVAAGIVVTLFALIPSYLGMASYTIATREGVARVLENPDFAFAFLATNVLGPALGLILLVSGLSATISSGDSASIAGVSIWINDLYPAITGKHVPEKRVKASSRLAVVITLVGAFLFSLIAKDVMSYITDVLGAVMPCIVVAIFFGKYWKRATGTACLVSVIFSLACAALYMTVPAIKAAIDGGFFAGPAIPVALVSGVLMIAVSLVTRPVTATEDEIMSVILEGRADVVAEREANAAGK